MHVTLSMDRARRRLESAYDTMRKAHSVLADARARIRCGVAWPGRLTSMRQRTDLSVDAPQLADFTWADPEDLSTLEAWVPGGLQDARPDGGPSMSGGI
jgi:hypothetical protein